jgi:hypothetical protein
MGAVVVGSALASPAFGGEGRGLRDDQIPFGPDGTIGRGTDSTGDTPGGRSGIKIFGIGRGDFDSGDAMTPSPYGHSPPGRGHIPGPQATTPASRLYPTNQVYWPGDGHGYPLYYCPATRGYFYCPVRRRD